jgi:hypothetical protein
MVPHREWTSPRGLYELIPSFYPFDEIIQLTRFGKHFNFSRLASKFLQDGKPFFQQSYFSVIRKKNLTL